MTILFLSKGGINGALPLFGRTELAWVGHTESSNDVFLNVRL